APGGAARHGEARRHPSLVPGPARGSERDAGVAREHVARQPRRSEARSRARGAQRACTSWRDDAGEGPRVNELDVSVRIDASASTVFRFFTDPVRMCEWMGVAADADPRPGGTYRVDVTGRDVASGSYVEIVPHERVVWTWGWEGNPDFPPGSSTVEVTLEADGDATVV